MEEEVRWPVAGGAMRWDHGRGPRIPGAQVTQAHTGVA